eukprot:6972294-Pyramimonas_sp.AAC.2
MSARRRGRSAAPAFRRSGGTCDSADRDLSNGGGLHQQAAMHAGVVLTKLSATPTGAVRATRKALNPNP